MRIIVMVEVEGQPLCRPATLWQVRNDGERCKRAALRTRIHHAEAIFHDENALTPLATNTGRPWGDRRQQPQSITGCTEHDARQAHRGGTTVTVCAVGDLSKLTHIHFHGGRPMSFAENEFAHRPTFHGKCCQSTSTTHKCAIYPPFNQAIAMCQAIGGDTKVSTTGRHPAISQVKTLLRMRSSGKNNAREAYPTHLWTCTVYHLSIDVHLDLTGG
mmetsp:Transcript_62740/g.137389  ORF Transcript_62740/g.137389 Transcript_62740/m.137389 type:complete len:216 (+) Transcript_62740:791-1438(+)